MTPPSPLSAPDWLGQALDRMVNTHEQVRHRLLRATGALCAGRIPYAVIGGNAVARLARVDPAATRGTQDVDVLIRRSGLPAVQSALAAAGFHYLHSAGLDLFLDSLEASRRNAVHVLFADEKVRPDEVLANPDVAESEEAGPFRLISLLALVRIKLTAFRLKDRVHLLDLIAVGLVGPEWLPRLPPALAGNLRALLAHPEG